MMPIHNLDRNKMKKFLFIIIALLAIFINVNAFAKKGETLDRIIAIVNDDVVTQSELTHAITMAKAQIARENLPSPPEAVLHKQVLDQIINKKLQLQIAKQVGIKTTERELNATIERIATQNNITVDILYEKITEEGMKKSDYRTEMRDQINMRKLQQGEIINKLTVDPKEVDKFLRSQVWQKNNDAPQEYQLEDILVPLSDNPSPQEITDGKKRAEVLLTKLKQGQSLRDVALTEPSHLPKIQLEDLGWRKVDELPSAFAEPVTKLKAKEIAGPIQTSNGLHLIRLTNVRSLGGAPAKPNRKQAEELLLQKKFEEALQVWLSKQRSQAFIDTNVKA